MNTITQLPDHSNLETRCLFLELPAELRLRIYEYVYDTPCQPQFFLRDDETIQQPMHRWFSHTGASLLRTCSKIYHEATPVMYSKATLRIQIYIGSGWPQYQVCGPLNSSNTLFKNIQNVDITLHLVDSKHIDPAFLRMGYLAQALEETGAKLKTVNVTFKAVTSYNMEVNRELVARHRDVMLRVLGQRRRLGMKGTRLFMKILVEGNIVAVN